MQEVPMDASGSPQVDTPEATALAREIHHLVQSSPLPSASRTSLDSRLVALLSNASFMNGSSIKPSIWSMLENIKRTPSPNSNPTSSPTHVGLESFKEDDLATASSPNVYPNQLLDESFSDTSSIMVYSPLFPTQSDIVELAELVPYDTDSGEVEERDVAANSTEGENRVRAQEVTAVRPSWTSMWPFSKWYRKGQSQQPTSQNLPPSLGSDGPQQQPAESITPSQVGGDTNSPRRPQRRIRAWVPSPSKISVQAFWWGYRLYLPPPILEVLSDRTYGATSRAAVITAALNWFFNDLPIKVFPSPLKHWLVPLQGLVPFIELIGICISWAWTWIISYDAGHGVTLTATWILPVALIPGTWHESDFPKSPTPNSPIPLPSFRPFSIEPATPAMSTMTVTDDDIPTSAYATPMSSIISLYPVSNALDENRVVDLSLASSSTAWSASPPPSQSQLPISSPIHYPTTILPNSPNGRYFTPNSSTTTPVVAHHSLQPLPSASSSSVPFTLNPSTTLPSPRIRTPRFSTRMGSFSPLSNSGIYAHIINPNNNTIPPTPPITPTISTSTPIPIPPTPIDLPPIPPEELPLCPNLVNQLLQGPVLQTVPLPDDDDDDDDD